MEWIHLHMYTHTHRMEPCSGRAGPETQWVTYGPRGAGVCDLTSFVCSIQPPCTASSAGTGRRDHGCEGTPCRVQSEGSARTPRTHGIPMCMCLDVPGPEVGLLFLFSRLLATRCRIACETSGSPTSWTRVLNRPTDPFSSDTLARRKQRTKQQKPKVIRDQKP